MTIEQHPLKPFLPQEARILFLGSFPPPRKRWSMEFFYPNWTNDFWRIMSLIFLGDRHALEEKEAKRFCLEHVVAFAKEHGLAFYDTAQEVCRTKDNASDQFLEIQKPTDVAALLDQLPHCHQVVTTGGKASEEPMRRPSRPWEGMPTAALPAARYAGGACLPPHVPTPCP